MATNQSTSAHVLRIERTVGKTILGLSAPLQAAKAGEHLTCAELILQGWNAVLADAGLPYDILVERGGGMFYRVQVKSTCTMMSERAMQSGTCQPRYRFTLRKSRTGTRRITLDACDHLALVALDRRLVAFVPVSAVTMADGKAASVVEFKSRAVAYTRPGKTGVNPAVGGKFIEDYATFCPE